MIRSDTRASASPDLDLLRHARAWLIGMEGVGLSGAARLLAARGYRVGGSDRQPGPRSDALKALGMAVDGTETAEALPEDVDLVVHSAAIPAGHPQLVAARQRGIERRTYAELLGALMVDRLAICVAGCHGKTTTSSLVTSCLIHAKRQPSFVVGGELRELGTGAQHGAGEHFVAESCEFDRSFHAHRPTVALVTNVDEDHLDYYRDLAEIQESFRVFAALVPPEGTLVVNDAFAALFQDDPRILATIETYGFDEAADWRCGEPEITADGRGMRFEVCGPGGIEGTLELPMLGRHNVLNGTGAAAALAAAGLSLTEIREGLAAFGGVGRRLEHVATRDVGGTRGVELIDDYGHHPAEIRAVVRALRRRFGDRRLVVVFQPHQASRTRCLMKDFAATLAEADEVWMPPIYFARDSEEERRAVTSEDLARHVTNEGGRALTLPDLPAVVEHGVEHLRDGDVLVTMGAGNVDEVARGLADRLR
ncbi:MAG: UDP-N-acetylmuramate--L-alanine ligase [Planctomycetota bacterium]|nr:UDP-N-acetylmuramate--L-alanine ligase [Planctomycetota bacterium]